VFLAISISTVRGIVENDRMSLALLRPSPAYLLLAPGNNFSKMRCTVILFHVCVHNSARRFVPLILLLGATPMAVWAQSKVPGYAIRSSGHYRQGGVGNARGRSGSANVTARALLGKDNNTTVELATGTLDSGPIPPGKFSKVQFKPLIPSGDALFAHNFNGLSTASGYYSFSWPSLHRGEQIQLQSGITGIDSNRTDVVTVYETVKMRPDLAVQNLTFPETAIV
jgi:hypothetical protein